MEQNEKSIFSRIINGEIPAHKIYEDDKVLAFLDNSPLTAGHTLLIPKQQLDYLFDLPDDLYNYLWQVAKKLAGPLRRAMNAKRIGIIVEGFLVPHTHIHLVPIDNDQQLKHGSRNHDMTDEEFAQIATKIKQAIAEAQ
ncbi:MAG: HIT domain-containing protein [Candidatus Nomurabacteria bacterium]|nr:HIT domain-containing protein [Candidatus Nomurabacteria bacterium]